MFSREPVVASVVGLDAVAVAVIAVLGEFGVVDWSVSQTAAVMGLVSAVSAVVARRFVTPNGTVAELVEAANPGLFEPGVWVDGPVSDVSVSGWDSAESS